MKDSSQTLNSTWLNDKQFESKQAIQGQYEHIPSAEGHLAQISDSQRIIRDVRNIELSLKITRERFCFK
jgi:hypothetical protein